MFIENCPAFLVGLKCLSITCSNPALLEGLNLVGPFAIFILDCAIPALSLASLTPWYDKLMKIKQSPYQKLKLFF